MDDDARAIRAMVEALSSIRVGALLIYDPDRTSRSTRAPFIVDGHRGELVLPVDARDLALAENDADALFCLPDEDPHSLQLTLSLRDVTDDAAAAEWIDRWTAYHATPCLPRARFARGRIVSARLGPHAVDGEALDLRNPLHACRAEARICRVLNADRAALRRACLAQRRADPTAPLAVGVDRWGVDVKSDFGILRLDFPEPVETEEACERALRTIIESPTPDA